MHHTVKTFDRGDHFCVVDTRSGVRVVSYPKKGPDGRPVMDPIAAPPQGAAPSRPRPTLLRRGINFLVAGAAHLAAGLPQSGDEVIAARFEICRACPLFTPDGSRDAAVAGICSHPSCGCNLKAVGVEGLNKLSWAESVCPINRWGAVKPVSRPEA